MKILPLKSWESTIRENFPLENNPLCGTSHYHYNPLYAQIVMFVDYKGFNLLHNKHMCTKSNKITCACVLYRVLCNQYKKQRIILVAITNYCSSHSQHSLLISALFNISIGRSMVAFRVSGRYCHQF